MTSPCHRCPLLKQLLAPTQGGGDLEAASESGSEEEGEGLDDSAMFRMDGMIAAVLRQGAAAKPNTQETKEHLRNFKFRRAATTFSAHISHVLWQRIT